MAATISKQLVAWFAQATLLNKLAMLAVLCVVVILWVATDQSDSGKAPVGEVKALINKGDYAAAIRILQPLADRGDAEAENDIATMHKEGWGFPQSDADAITWFRRSAEHGNAEAQGTLGAMYREGEGVAQDYVRAWLWFNRAAQNANQAMKSHVEMFTNLRDGLEYLMNRAQLAEAKRLATQGWIPDTASEQQGHSSDRSAEQSAPPEKAGSANAQAFVADLRRMLRTLTLSVNTDLQPCRSLERPEDLQTCGSGLADAISLIQATQERVGNLEVPACLQNTISTHHLVEVLAMERHFYSDAATGVSWRRPDMIRNAIDQAAAGDLALDHIVQFANDVILRGLCQ
jgi:hypothetical protein